MYNLSILYKKQNHKYCTVMTNTFYIYYIKKLDLSEVFANPTEKKRKNLNKTKEPNFIMTHKKFSFNGNWIVKKTTYKNKLNSN